MIIPLGTGDWKSAAEDIAGMRVHNMYIAEDPSSPDNMTRLSRPTLRTVFTVGAGPIRGIWRQDGTFNNEWLILSDTSLYLYNPVSNTSTLIGTIPGTDLCQFSGGSDRVLILSQGVVYSTDGVTMTTVAMPDDQLVRSLGYINSYFLLSILGSDRFYWIIPGGTDPDPLDFATAERTPDPIEAIAVVSDEVWFIGTAGTEVWAPSGDSLAPFQRISGRVYDEGCADRNTLVISSHSSSPAAAWVTAQRSVVAAKGNVTKISNESIEEQLKTATNLRAWGLRHNRHDFYILSSDTFTLVYDINMDNWLSWTSYGKSFWNANLGLQNGPIAYGVSTSGNSVYILEPGDDDDGVAVVRKISGRVDITGNPQACFNVSLKVNSGWSPAYDYTPYVELRWSDDQGETWSLYKQQSMGNKGKYDREAVFRSLGLMVRPGRIFEVRFSGRGRFRLDYAALNEA